MDDDELERRLHAARDANHELAVSATVRLPSVTASVGETLAAPTGTVPRALPHLSVDLRGTLDARPSRPPATTGADLEVVGLIGEGGMGRVLLARQHSMDRDVAVKTTKDDAPESARDALLVEGRITGRLEHPSIVPMHALGVDDAGRPALVMKRIEGTSWLALLRDPAHAAWADWGGEASDRLLGHLEFLSMVSNAVHFAHSRGFVHRDIKPENVLVGRYGDVYLADWGVATRVGERETRLCGTPGYMAPEMVSSGVVDARTDVYLLGAVLHEVLVGRMRHHAPTTLAALVRARLSEPHAYPESVPAELAQLANDACAADPEARPPSAKAFRERIDRYLAHRQSIAIGAAARARLTRLETLLTAPDATDEERAEIERLGAEARFGLEQALAQWDGNDAAREALARLEAILEERRRRAGALEREARERDPRVAARARAVGLTALSVFSVGLSIAAFYFVTVPTPAALVAFPTSLMAVIALGIYVFRRDVLATAFNRQVALIVVGAVVLVLIGRAEGFFLPIEPATHFARDSFMLAGAFGVTAVAYLRWTAWVAAVFLVTSVLCTAVPSHCLQFFGVGAAGAVVVAAVFAWRAARE